MNEHTTIRGHLAWQHFAADGSLLASGEADNLVTSVGDRMYAERGAGASGALAAPTGMKLGTGATAPAKTGAGSALTTFLSGSQHAFDSAPTVAAQGGGYRVTFTTTYAPGQATTASAITEAVLVNETLTNATSSSAATVARILITGLGSKGSGETVVFTWTHDILGA